MDRLPSICALALVALALGACGPSHQVTRVGGAADVQLERGAGVVIATPADGAYGDKKYPQSGIKTATALRAAFNRYTPKTALLHDCAKRDCLEANAGEARYLVLPVIVHWEDRATNWSGKLDRINVQVTIYDRKNGEELTAATVSNETSGVLVVTDEPPEVLLEAACEAYVRSLYGDA